MKTDRIILAGLLILIAGCEDRPDAVTRATKSVADNERARKVCQSQGKKIAPLDIWRRQDGRLCGCATSLTSLPFSTGRAGR